MSRRLPGGHLDDSDCAALVLGLASADERKAAIEHASGCVDCAVRLRAHAGSDERWRSAAPGARARRARRWPWALAAAAGLTFVALIPRFQPPHAVHGTLATLAPPGEDVLRREGGSEDAHLREGLSAYSRGDLARAARELAEARTVGADEEARRLYLAQVLLMTGDEREALSLLRSLHWELLPLHVQHEAVALYARTLRANGRTASADSIEHALRQTPEWLPLRP